MSRTQTNHSRKGPDPMMLLKQGAQVFASSVASSARERYDDTKTQLADGLDRLSARAANATTAAGERAALAASAGGKSLADLIRRHPLAVAGGIVLGGYVLMRWMRR
ncbi:MAG: hypothetical protein R2939_02875 [Kofleriaceae bacterium]